MPAFDLQFIKVAKYINTNGVITYDDPVDAGDAMTANLELRHAEGRLYAKGSLAEYMKKATGGTVSLGTKYIPSAAQKLMYGAVDASRSIGSGETAKTITGLKHSAGDKGENVGVFLAAPDVIDGVEKVACVFISRALFGPPSYSYETMGEGSIKFNTPTTSGEFMPDHSTGHVLIETYICDDLTDAQALCNVCFGYTPAT